MQYLKPSLRESDIPHRTKTRNEILERAQLVVEHVKEKLKTEQLAFSPIEGNHSGQNIGRILIKAIEKYDLTDKVNFRITL